MTPGLINVLLAFSMRQITRIDETCLNLWSDITNLTAIHSYWKEIELNTWYSGGMLVTTLLKSWVANLNIVDCLRDQSLHGLPFGQYPQYVAVTVSRTRYDT